MLNQDLRRETVRQSDERHHRMVEEIEDYAIILLDREGFIQNWNKGAEKIKGYKADEIIGKNFRQFYTDEDRTNKLPDRLLNEAADHGRASHEGWRVKKDGSLFWANIVITALHNESGNVIGFTKVTRDLTERKKAEEIQANATKDLIENIEALRRSEERYHKMVEEVKDYAILLLDKEGNIQNWNAGAEQIKGYRSSEIIGKNFKIFYLPHDIEAGLPEKLLREAQEKGRATHEGWRKRKDGTRFWGSIVITALHDKKNNLIGYSKVTRDLTEQKIAEDKLKQYAHQLEIKNQELEEFAYVASHDLKEPLRKIVTFGDLLQQSIKETGDEKSISFAGRMQDAAHRMMSLIDDLLLFSRVGNDDERMEMTSLNAIVEAVLQDLEPAIKQKNATINIGPLPTIKARPLQIQQLFQNLIGNAIKFNDKPDPHVTITNDVVPATEGDRIQRCRIMVSDNGIGFDNEHKGRIFEIFQRLHGRSQYSGSGIGLAICKKIVENHHGTIEAVGNEGQGACFIITLPC